MKGSELHIARLVEAWRADSILFLVLDFYPVTLSRMLQRVHKISLYEEDVVRMSYSMICALNFLHSAGVMHRDIKPSNLLIDENFNIRFCDFGLARGSPVRKPVSMKKLPFSPKHVKELKKVTRKPRSEKQLKSCKRSLSNHVCSRYYRPPEIILLQKKYG
mmetsp:Transcript_41859/g.64046  ORF Transcript_41859/g.64046 Transcript_41859/m.64046 type:complete len:161 (-) Transcript_41859:611-1093(-)